MSIGRNLVLLAACFALAAAPLPGAVANGQTAAHRAYRHNAYAHRTYPRQPYARYWPRQDAQGWRWRDNYGWDNTCLNVPWLASQFACSSHGR